MGNTFTIQNPGNIGMKLPKKLRKKVQTECEKLREYFDTIFDDTTKTNPLAPKQVKKTIKNGVIL